MTNISSLSSPGLLKGEFSATPSLSDDGSFCHGNSFTDSKKLLFTLDGIAIFGNSLIPLCPRFPSFVALTMVRKVVQVLSRLDDKGTWLQVLKVKCLVALGTSEKEV